MTMHWTSYLVRVHPEVDTMDERMERAHRGEVIMDRFTRFVSMRKSQIGLTATVSNPSPHQHSQKRDHHASSQQALADA